MRSFPQVHTFLRTMLLCFAVLFVAANIGFAQEAAKGRIIVVRKSVTPKRDFSALWAQSIRGAEWLAEIRLGGVEGTTSLYRIVSETQDTKSLLDLAKNDPSVLLAFEDRVGRLREVREATRSELASNAPAEVAATQNWYVGSAPYMTVRADMAATVISGQPLTPRGTIAVIGTGLDTSVDVFQVHRPSNGVWGHSLIGNDLTDVHNHETRVVSQLSMVTSADVAIEIYAIKMIHDDGHGFISDVIKSLQYVIDQKMLFRETRGRSGANFVAVNLSLGFVGSGTDLAILRDKLNEASGLGVFSAMGSGNQLDVNSLVFNLDENPSANGLASGARCLPGSTAVAASRADGSQLADFSYYGPQTVEIAAPGSGNLAVGVGGVLTFFGGTSASTPFLTGAGAELVLRRGLTPLQARSQLIATASQQVTFGGRVKDNNLLDFGAAMTAPIVASHVGFLDVSGKMKYFSGARELKLSGVTDSTACVQGFGGFVIPSSAAVFDTVLTGDRLQKKLLVYNKAGVDERAKSKLKP